ncbi:hypothetical protein ACFW04_013733 [Cataglyphis niger]
MQSSICGFGFKLVISCISCESISVNSSPLINNKAYDINRRIIFAFRLLGIPLRGIEKFCKIMDLPNVIYYVCNMSMENAMKEKQKLITEMGKGLGLTVSGDGTWRKRGFSSHYGVSTIIGFYSGKVIDLIINSSYCKACEYWSKNLDTVEFELWKENHKEECSVNHEGSSGKMEYNVRYTNYIGNGDSKTYKGIVDANPYEEKVIKKCIDHVQKNGHTTSRNEKSHLNNIPTKSSTDEKPQHDNCPFGEDSWCSWHQKSKAIGTLDVYEHKNLPLIVQDAIRSIYEDLSSDELLEQCEEGFTQNSNENLNAKNILLIMNMLHLKIGNRCYDLCIKVDKQRCNTAEIRVQKNTKEARQARRSYQKEAQDAQTAAEEILYGPGIAD